LEVLELNIGIGPDPVVTDAALAGLSKLKRVTHLMIQNGTVTGRGLAAVAGFDRLEVLQLSGNPVDDAAVQTLGQLTALKELELTRTTIAAPKLAAGLKGLRGLRELNLSFSELTDADVPSLAGLSQLRRLSLSGTKLTDAAAPPLAAMPELRMLDLAATEVTDAGAKALGAAKSLTHLDLSHSKVTDAGVSAVAKLPGLKVLGASGLPLTNKSLEALAGVPSLLAVRVDSKAITEGGLAKFKAAKPNVVLSKW
jgi:Leucine-rich repeat (LRR) protein